MMSAERFVAQFRLEGVAFEREERFCFRLRGGDFFGNDTVLASGTLADGIVECRTRERAD